MSLDSLNELIRQVKHPVDRIRFAKEAMQSYRLCRPNACLITEREESQMKRRGKEIERVLKNSIPKFIDKERDDFNIGVVGFQEKDMLQGDFVSQVMQRVSQDIPRKKRPRIIVSLEKNVYSSAALDSAQSLGYNSMAIGAHNLEASPYEKMDKVDICRVPVAPMTTQQYIQHRDRLRSQALSYQQNYARKIFRNVLDVLVVIGPVDNTQNHSLVPSLHGFTTYFFADQGDLG